MRIELTIDDEIAERLELLSKATGSDFNSILSLALRLGVQELSRPLAERRRYVQPVATAGGCKVDLVSVSAALVIAEGEGYR